MVFRVGQQTIPIFPSYETNPDETLEKVQHEVQYAQGPHHQYAAHGSSTPDALHALHEEDMHEVQYSQTQPDPPFPQCAAQDSTTSGVLPSLPDGGTYEVQYSQLWCGPSCSPGTQWCSSPTLQTRGSGGHSEWCCATRGRTGDQ